MGWYPTSVRVTPDGRRLLVANGKGVTPKANPDQAPTPPESDYIFKPPQYIASLYKGTLSVIDLPLRRRNSQTQMAAWTAEAYSGAPLKAGEAAVTRPRRRQSHSRQRWGSQPDQILHLIIKENRTYDQVLGDMPQGQRRSRNSVFFPSASPPTSTSWRGDFVLLDNLYADAEVSASGHEWSTAAYCTDFVEKTWPVELRTQPQREIPLPRRRLFSPLRRRRLAIFGTGPTQAGVSFRSYGEFVSYNQGRDQTSSAVKALEALRSVFRDFDLGYSDLGRADRFIAEFKRPGGGRSNPRLANHPPAQRPHPRGFDTALPEPAAYLAENDLALGRIVEAVSRSKIWTQKRPLRHRRRLAKRLRPCRCPPHHGLRGQPLCAPRRDGFHHVFHGQHAADDGIDSGPEADVAIRRRRHAHVCLLSGRAGRATLQRALPETANLEERNTPTAWGAGLKMNFVKEDAADPFLLNEVIWKSVRGANSVDARTRPCRLCFWP